MIIQPNDKWDRRFMKMARDVSEWSKDTTKVGAIIVNDNKRVVGTGYNGFPKKMLDLPERYADRDFKIECIIHAEENAILDAGKEAEGCTIYVYPTLMIPACCPHCASIIAQAGIKRLVQWYRTDLSSRWQTKAGISSVILYESDITVTLKEPNDTP